MLPFEDKMKQGGAAAIQEVSRFFMKKDPVHESLYKIAKRLRDSGIPHTIVGGLAVVVHGYARTTVDIDVLVTPEGLKKAHEHLSGLGYVPIFEGSRNLRDTETSVRIEFVVTGEFPGDGKPKPVAFPHPSNCATEIDGIRYLRLEKLIDLKLASGMTNPGRLKDLADAQELIRGLKLSSDFALRLDPYVRERFKELWAAVQLDQSEPGK